MTILKIIAVILTAVTVVLVVLFAQQILPELKLLGMLALALAWLFALIFVYFGSEIVGLMPPVKRFKSVQETWGRLNVDSTRKAHPSLLSDVVAWRFEEVSDASNPPERLNEVKNLSVGHLATVVARRRPAFRNLTRELQAYSAAFVTLFVVGMMLHFKELSGQSLSKIADIVFSENTIPLLEVVTIVYLIIRFTSEMGWIRSIIDGE